MNKMSQDGRGVADAMTAQDVTNRRKADLNLRSDLRKLITKISLEQMVIHELTCRSSDDAKWDSVAGLVKAWEGQVRIVNPEQAWWVLVDLQHGQQPTSDLLTNNMQFRVRHDGEPAAHGSLWLSSEAELSSSVRVSLQHALIHPSHSDLVARMGRANCACRCSSCLSKHQQGVAPACASLFHRTTPADPWTRLQRCRHRAVLEVPPCRHREEDQSKRQKMQQSRMSCVLLFCGAAHASAVCLFSDA